MSLYTCRCVHVAQSHAPPALILTSSLTRTAASLRWQRSLQRSWHWQLHKAVADTFATSATSAPKAKSTPAKRADPGASTSPKPSVKPQISKPPQPVSPKHPSSSSSLPPTSSFTGTRGKAPPAPSPSAKEYPARLLIYRCPTLLIFQTISFRLLAIVTFIFAVVAVAPAYYYSPVEPTWMAAFWIGAGAIPVIVTVGVVPPLVAYVHIGLPRWARMSPDRLRQFAQHLPPSAVIDIATVRWIWPRVTRLSASELYIKPSPSGSLRLHRNVPAEVYASREWYHWRPAKRFHVTGKGSRVADNDIWPEVLSSIRRGWGNDLRPKQFRSESK